MKEIDRRVMGHEGGGMACGPMGIYAADAEITVEDEGRTVCLHAQWVDEAYDSILFEATTESTYECYRKLNDLEDGELEIEDGMDENDMFDDLICERNRICEECDMQDLLGDVDLKERYAKEYSELIAMLQEQLDKDDIGFNLTTMEFTDEDEDEEED